MRELKPFTIFKKFFKVCLFVGLVLCCHIQALHDSRGHGSAAIVVKGNDVR